MEVSIFDAYTNAVLALLKFSSNCRRLGEERAQLVDAVLALLPEDEQIGRLAETESALRPRREELAEQAYQNAACIEEVRDILYLPY